jgi:hypothetical protein
VHKVIIYKSTGSPRFKAVCFTTIYINDGFEIRRPKEFINNFKKCANINTGYEVTKQHSQSETTAIPIYYLSRSGMRWPEIRGEEH